LNVEDDQYNHLGINWEAVFNL